jgi:nucleoside-diphosphate-sugar epimerase
VKEIIEYTCSKSLVYYAPYRKNESSSTRILLDISKAQKVLEYYPIISFKEGLEQTVSWLKENYDWYK